MLVTIGEAQSNLPELLKKLREGEDEVLISDNGHPVARLVPILEPGVRNPRVPGSAKGEIWLAPDFDDPLPEEALRAFEGES